MGAWCPRGPKEVAGRPKGPAELGLQRLGHVGWIAVDAVVMVVEAVRGYRKLREPVT